MASTDSGARLTEEHRRAQLTIRAAAVREFTRLWPLLNPQDLDTTSAGWVEQTTDLVLRHRRVSAQRAADYYPAFRAAETGQFVAPRFDLALGPPLGALRTSLAVTGPIGIKSRTAKGMTPELAARTALADTSRAATRYVLNGGRDTLVGAVDDDEVAVAFARVTDGNPCAFCAMLAARRNYKGRRSSLYRSDGHRYHNGCGCTVEPIFNDQQPLPPVSETFERLWADTTAGLSGRTARNAFRRAVERPQTSRA